MSQPIEFGYFGPTGSSEARGQAFAPALKRALEVAREAFTSVWFADHFMFDDADVNEAWAVLTYAAALVPGLQLGHMVLCNGYRPPSLTAKMGASLQALTGGRFVLGYGAGWHKPEFVAYGYDFPGAATRIAMMEEGLRVIKTMWQGAPATFHGRYYHVEDARCEPRPDPMPPIMIGGGGERLTLRAVARHADWWNAYQTPPETATRKLDALKAHCAAEGRDYASIRKTWSGSVFLDRDHAAAVKAAGDALAGDQTPIAGDPAAVTEQLRALAELGFDMFQLGFERFPDTGDMELFISEVLPRFR